MKKIILLLKVACLMSICSCSQESFIGPAYKWDLFENTVNWNLAKAVAKEDTLLIRKIIESHAANIDLQEPKFGRTLLMLAVGNDKVKSVKCLLQLGADVSIRDNSDDQAIHEATQYISLKKNSLGILQLLLKYNSDPNAQSTKGQFSVPLEGAVDNLECAKLLVNSGADIYFKKDNAYPIWINMLVADYSDKIYFAKYIILDKKMAIPNPIYFGDSRNAPIDIFGLLKKTKFTTDKEKLNASEMIFKYLHNIGFPKNGLQVYSIQSPLKPG